MIYYFVQGDNQVECMKCGFYYHIAEYSAHLRMCDGD